MTRETKKVLTLNFGNPIKVFPLSENVTVSCFCRTFSQLFIVNFHDTITLKLDNYYFFLLLQLNEQGSEIQLFPHIDEIVKIVKIAENQIFHENFSTFIDCDVNCHKKCEKLAANLCGVNQKLIVEALASVRKENQGRKFGKFLIRTTTNKIIFRQARS